MGQCVARRAQLRILYQFSPRIHFSNIFEYNFFWLFTNAAGKLCGGETLVGKYFPLLQITYVAFYVFW